MVGRRELLKYGGSISAIAVGSLSGGTSPFTADERELPPEYIEHLVADDGWLSFAYVNLYETSLFDRFGNDARGIRFENELLYAFPLDGLYTLVAKLHDRLERTGLVGLLYDNGIPPIKLPATKQTASNDPDETRPTREEFDSVVGDLLALNGATILEGSGLDRGEIVTALRNRPDEATDTVPYERYDERDGYALYQPESDSNQNPTIGVSDGSVVVTTGHDADERIGATISAARGYEEPETVSNDELEWLIETAGDGHVVFGGYGRSEASNPRERNHWGDRNSLANGYDRLHSATGVVSSISFEDETTTTASFGAYYENIGVGLGTVFRGQLAATADERTVAVNTSEDRVRATGTWKDPNPTR